MKRHIYTLAFLLITLTTLAQSKRANIWYFGINAGLDFNTNPPTALTNGQINTVESAGATICDTSGKLLFYTDGVNVFNKQHSIMQNGGNLDGNRSATQSAIIIPWPQRDSLYYIFTSNEAGYSSSAFRWHLVNMKLDSGRGSIISRDNFILGPVCEKLTATYHANGKDIWVMVHGSSQINGSKTNDSFYSYLITTEGFQNCPVISKIGDKYDVGDAVGGMKFDEKGTMLAVCPWFQSKVDVYKFDNISGRLTTNLYQLYTVGRPYGVEFNHNNIYASSTRNSNYFVRFDLNYINNDSINKHSHIIAVNTNKFTEYSWIQNGVDGNIYLGMLMYDSLSYISNVEKQADSLIYNYNAIGLLGKYQRYSFPNYITNYFNTKEPPFYYDLSNDSIKIYTKANNPKWLLYKDSILIDSSTNQNPNFKTVDNSSYNIKLITASNDTFERAVYTKPSLVSDHEISLCDKDSFLLTANLDYHCISWQDTISTPELWIYASGTYKVSGLDGNNSYSSDSIKVTFLKTPKPDLGRDTAFCGNETYTLKADSGYKYIWSNGDTSSSIVISKAGIYSLVERNRICEASDTIKIDILPIPQPLISRAGNILDVNPAYTNFQWYKNQQPINGAKASQYTAPANGNYYVIVIDSNGCSGSSDTVGLNVGIDNITQSKPSLFPNPVNDKLYIEFTDLISWQLFDIAGNAIENGNSRSLDFRNYPSGIYLMKITSNDNSNTFKIIKQ